MTNKERGKAIREELKKAGYTSKQLSVRSRNCGYLDETRIYVKDLSCDINAIRNICEKFEQIDYDQYTGEILMGGNTYIFVEWDWETIHNATESKMEEAEKVVDEIENGKEIFSNEKSRFVVCYDRDRDLYDIAEFKHGEHCGMIRVSPCVKNQMVYTLARALATNFQELVA